ARVNDLLSRMTVPEKIGQMVQIEVTQVTDTSNDCTSQGGSTCRNRSVSRRSSSTTTWGRSWQAGLTSRSTPPVRVVLAIRARTGPTSTTPCSLSRSGILGRTSRSFSASMPSTASGTHGRPLFPQSIGMGATWDPSAAKAGGEVTADALRATGWNWDFAPVQDLARDNRWGRYYETWAEEPALAAAMGAANVRGLQSGGHGGLGVTAPGKHFAGDSQSINGPDRVQAELPIRYLQDTFMPSYAGAIDAGAGTVMVNSGSVNGIPATASHWLLTTELRHQLGFRGVVISDFGDVGALATTYHMAADLKGAAALAI